MDGQLLQYFQRLELERREVLRTLVFDQGVSRSRNKFQDLMDELGRFFSRQPVSALGKDTQL